jgi:hypothetical protein
MLADILIILAGVFGLALIFIGARAVIRKGEQPAPRHARTEPEPERSPLERTTLLEDPPPSSPRNPDPFAHVDIGTVPDPDGSRYVEALRGDEVAVAAAVARERAVEPPPVPPVPLAPPGAAPVPFVPSLPVFSAPVPSAPLEPLPPMAVRESGAFLDRDLAGRHHKPWTGPAMTDQATGMRMPLEADRMAGVLAAMKAWTPNPAVPQERGPVTTPDIRPDELAEDRPVTAGDETREIFLGLARQMNWLTPAEQVALWDREFCTPITVGEPPANLAGASVAGLAEWDLRAPLSLPGGQRPATEADGSDAA